MGVDDIVVAAAAAAVAATDDATSEDWYANADLNLILAWCVPPLKGRIMRRGYCIIFAYRPLLYYIFAKVSVQLCYLLEKIRRCLRLAVVGSCARPNVVDWST